MEYKYYKQILNKILKKYEKNYYIILNTSKLKINNIKEIHGQF